MGSTQQRRPPVRTVNVALVNALLRERGWTRTRLAREMGMDRAHVTEVLLGRAAWGPAFLTALLDVFPRHTLDDLFPVPHHPVGGAA
ncbi:helix-turn-helix domain-containing protein [Pseudonocardia asaccharolytica]|uniref:HTH cro/C1-type domain-containing protein n=1 Tax=Pseudonocardia asaccharolytica DSM 44247 = NBRC 16224 TaxID=1123024 RepID=A0A511D490_9PSEU|nr:helix-turn-helix transcriptional regulator [Pseudonocardia asaccharolytica]GEL19293.1 hypothetical protein PA7_31300 [Pseudonocardia asaccharolytica DSM 44247 = NBRC 16224]